MCIHEEDGANVPPDDKLIKVQEERKMSKNFTQTLSPEVIHMITESAVASVAAQKIVTQSIAKSLISKDSKSGKIRVKSSKGPRKAIAPSSKKASAAPESSSEGMIKRARELAASVISQTTGRKQLQASFSQVVRQHKK